MWAQIQAGDNPVISGYEISADDIELRRVERDGFAAKTITSDDGKDVSLVLDMADSPELLSKGLARDITRRIQAKRKELDLEIEATISLRVWTADAPEIFSADEQWITSETRAASSQFTTGEGEGDFFEVDGAKVWFQVE